MTRTVLYSLIVAEFCIAGVLDLVAGQIKQGVVAIGFGVLNGLIFLWR